MSRRRFRIRYADVASTLALLMAIGGTAYAATALPRHSVGTEQLKPGAVTEPKLRDGAVTGTKISEGAVGNTQIADGSITTVKIGAGQITEGHFAPGVVRSVAVQDESLTVDDLKGAQLNLNLAGTSLPSGECANYSIGATGAEVGQIAVAGWLATPPAGIVADARVTGTNQIGFRICNVTGSQASFAGGSGVVRVITFG